MQIELSDALCGLIYAKNDYQMRKWLRKSMGLLFSERIVC